jgi:hypothetical protein
MALAGSAAPVCGQSKASYPASRAPADLVAWLKRVSPLDPARVADVSDSSVTAIMSAQPTRDPPGYIAILHAETLDPELEIQEHILSWSLPVEVDCQAHKVRLGQMTGYASRDIRTGGRPIRQADEDWVAPAPRAPLDSVTRALCEPGFQAPLGGKVRFAAQAAKAPPPGPVPVVVAPPPKIAIAASAPVPVPAKAEAPRPEAPKPDASKPDMPRPETSPKPEPADTVAKPTAKPAPVTPAARAVPPAEPRKPVATPTFAGGGTIAVQIGASPVMADTTRVIDRAKRKFATEFRALTPSVVTATVDGKPVYRALVSGLRTNADANALCKALSAGGQACFVRR